MAILAGAGALHATDKVMQVAETLGVGVAKSLLGKAAVPDDLPYVTGSVRWLGTRASNEMMKQCDTLLVIGSAFPYTEFLPKEGQARGVQIDIAPKNLGIRYPMEVPLTGDSAEMLHALLPLLDKKADRCWREQIERSVREWKEESERRATAAAPPLNPQLPLWELSPRLPDNCIITSDSSSVAVWAARLLELRRGMMMSVSGGLATMGSALPYALAAKFAYPDRVVIATVGDGGMQMSGNGGLIDVAKHWNRWSDPRLIVLVLNNRDLNCVTWEQRVTEGEPKFEDSQVPISRSRNTPNCWACQGTVRGRSGCRRCSGADRAARDRGGARRYIDIAAAEPGAGAEQAVEAARLNVESLNGISLEAAHLSRLKESGEIPFTFAP